MKFASARQENEQMTSTAVRLPSRPAFHAYLAGDNPHHQFRSNAAQSRIGVYRVLAVMSRPPSAGTLPVQSEISRAASVSSATLSEKFDPQARQNRHIHTMLGRFYQPSRPAEQMVWEAKEWTFEPFAAGWHQAVRETRQPPQAAGRALAATVAIWATSYPALAMLGPRWAPSYALNAADHLVGGHDGNTRMLHAALEQVAEAACAAEPETTPAALVNVVRTTLAAIRYSAAEQREYDRDHLVRSIGQYITRWGSADVPDSMLAGVLRVAAESLTPECAPSMFTELGGVLQANPASTQSPNVCLPSGSPKQ